MIIITKYQQDQDPQERRLLSSLFLEEGIYWIDSKTMFIDGANWSGSRWNCKSCRYSDDRFGIARHLKLKHGKPLVVGCRLKPKNEFII